MNNATGEILQNIAVKYCRAPCCLDKSDASCIISCMSIKTISLELDAYEKLKSAKQGSESFSQVVRRARFDPELSTGTSILRELEALYAVGGGVPEETLRYWDDLEKEKADSPRMSPNPWEAK